MYTSLLSPGGEPVKFCGLPTDQEEARSFLFSPSLAPQTLAYRREFEEELTHSVRMRELFRLCAKLPDLFVGTGESFPDEVKQYDRILAFLEFARVLEGFCDASAKVLPQSQGAKRCFLIFRNYREGYEYRKQKADARELIREMNWESGYSVLLNCPEKPGAALVVKEPSLPDGICFAIAGARKDFSKRPLSMPSQTPLRNETETALLMQILRKKSDLFQRIKAWNQTLQTSEITQILCLGKEAQLYLLALSKDAVLWDSETEPAEKSETTTTPESCQNQRLTQMAAREKTVSPEATYEEAFEILRENAISLMEHLRFLQQNNGDFPLLRIITEQVSVYPLLRPETAKVILHFSATSGGAMVCPQIRYIGNDDQRYWDKHVSGNAIALSLPKDRLDSTAAAKAVGRLANDFCQLTQQIREGLT